MSTTPNLWFPDLCRLKRVGLLMGLAQMVVVMLLLAPFSNTPSVSWVILSSVIAQWLTLTVALALCQLRPWLGKQHRWLGWFCALSVGWLLAFCLTSMIYRIDQVLELSGFSDAASSIQFATQSASIITLLMAIVIQHMCVLDQYNAQLHASAQAQVDALQARIKPHFLFNSMNTIVSLIGSNPQQAEQAVLDLSDLFRSALGGTDKPSSLREEIELVKRYLSIEKLRLGDRLDVVWDFDQHTPWETPMPRLLLQPLFENAILHGVAQTEKGGTVSTKINVFPDQLQIIITNPTPSSPSTHHTGAHHAQSSVLHRLKHLHGSQSSLIGTKKDGGYTCTMIVPISK